MPEAFGFICEEAGAQSFDIGRLAFDVIQHHRVLDIVGERDGLFTALPCDYQVLDELHMQLGGCHPVMESEDSSKDEPCAVLGCHRYLSNRAYR